MDRSYGRCRATPWHASPRFLFGAVHAFRAFFLAARRLRASDLRQTALFVQCCSCIGVIVASSSAVAAVDPGELPAETARLAPQSLLLDLAHAGSRLVTVGERGHVLLSDNKGGTWRQAKRVPTQNLLTSVCFSDERNGIAVGHDEIVLTTADAGETWTRTHYAPEAQQPLLSVLCNGHDAIAVGAYSTYFSSKDSGATWSERKFEAQSKASKSDDTGEDFHLNRVVSASGARLYIAGEAGHLYRSDDAGATWAQLPSPYEGSFFGVLPLNGDALLAYGLRGHLFRSDDGGATWRAIETHTEAMLNDAVRLPGGGVAVVGLSGVVLLSADDGEHFTLAQQDDRKGLSAVRALGATQLVTVGEGGVKLIPLQARK